MKKLIVLVFAAIVGLAAFYVSEGFLDAMLHGGSSASSSRRLAQISRQMNAGLPKQLDKETRFDTTMAGPGNRLTYRYTLVNLSRAQADRADLAVKMKPVLVNGYKTLPAMEALRKARVELCYQYSDKDGNEVATIIVSPNDF